MSNENKATEPASSTSREPSTIALVVLGFVLVVVLVGANVAIATDRTALDADRTIETMDDAGVSTELTVEMRAEMKETIRDSLSEQEAAIISEEDIEEITEIAITESYVRGEIDRNIRTVYEFLHGDRESMSIAIDLTGPRERAVTEIEERERERRPTGEPQIAPRVEDEIPDQEHLTDGDETPEELDRARTVVDVIGTLTWLLPVLSVGLVGLLYHYSGRSLRRCARYAGIAFVIAGVLGLAIGYALGGVATGTVESALDPDGSGVTAALANGVVAMLENLFATIATYAWIPTALGIGAIVLAHLERYGYLGDVGGDEIQDRHQ